MVVMLLSLASCSRPQSIRVSVERGISIRNPGGDAGLEIFLAAESEREFAVFTANFVGRTLEFRFLGRVLATPVLRDAILKGHFQIGASPGAGLTADNVDEIAGRLSTTGAKLEVRVLDEK